ncbi:hypothetical protein J7E62_32495 [Variovorax paradoxus]|nr:hypothetical protein [Variovorax paradoxus]
MRINRCAWFIGRELGRGASARNRSTVLKSSHTANTYADLRSRVRINELETGEYHDTVKAATAPGELLTFRPLEIGEASHMSVPSARFGGVGAVRKLEEARPRKQAPSLKVLSHKQGGFVLTLNHALPHAVSTFNCGRNDTQCLLG